MVDTQKTWAEVQSLLASGTTASISAQDVRNAHYSFVNSFGGVWVAGNTTATTISAANTDYVTNWNSGGAESNTRLFTASTGGRLTYDGTVDTHCHVACTISYYVGVAASKELEFKIVKNGTTVVGGSKVTVDTDGNTTKQSTALHCDVLLVTNDYLELWCSNETDTTNITIYDAYLFSFGVIVTS